MPPPRPFPPSVALVAIGLSLAAQDGSRAAARGACADLLRATRTDPAAKPLEDVVQAVFAAKDLGRHPGTVAAVRKALAAGDALVEFVQWPDLGGDRLTAFVVRPEGPIVRVEIGPAAEVQLAVTAHLRLLARWQQPLDAASKRLGEGTSQRVRNLVLAPIEPALASCQRVWFAADGALLPLPFEALPAASEDTFLLEAIDVRRLPCGTDLLGDLAPCGQGLLVVDGGATDLPEATREARSIAQAWEAIGQGPVHVRRASDPGSFDAAVRSSGFVHFATKAEFVRNGGRLPVRVQVVDAAANSTAPFPADLSACRLVVVSGCDPGPGDPVPGLPQIELRRMLRLAGARTVATTGWPVDDRFTREWMEQFWQALRIDDDPARVGRQTKLAWLDRNRRQRLDPLPGTWAAFVFEGR